jgi:rod shape-determining protein MreD
MSNTFFKWFGLIILIYVLQTTIVPVISIAGVKPDLLLLVLFFLGFKHDVIPAVIAGFLIGLAQDFYSPEILGQNALAKTIAGFFAGLFNEKVIRLDPLFQLLMFSLMFLIHDTAFYTVQIAKSGIPFQTIGLEIVVQTLPRTLYTLFFALIPSLKEYFFPSPIRR